MPQRVKLVAFVFCLWSFCSILGMLLYTRPGRIAPLRGADGQRVVSPVHQASSPSPVVWVGVGLCAASSVVMLIDAVRREYEGPKGLALAVAIVGVISLGMLSAIYFLIWGWKPYRLQPATATEFCEACLAETINRGAPGVFAHQGTLGTTMMGGSKRCEHCGSTLKTLWFMLILPLFPIASYRILYVRDSTVSRASYAGRRRPGLDWTQVAVTYAIVLAALSLIAMILVRQGQ